MTYEEWMGALRVGSLIFLGWNALVFSAFLIDYLARKADG
jgi:hypothetical protein